LHLKLRALSKILRSEVTHHAETTFINVEMEYEWV
jgi:hypothetical protein